MASESLSEQLSERLIEDFRKALERLIEDFRENINLEAIMSDFPKTV